jgi:hypothetical protein
VFAERWFGEYDALLCRNNADPLVIVLAHLGAAPGKVRLGIPATVEPADIGSAICRT